MELINDRLLSWASILEDQARQQAERSARLVGPDGEPLIAGHVALMPDAHWGMGATVGSVIPTERAIIPAAVGVDIGCGMVATETSLTASARTATSARRRGMCPRASGRATTSRREPLSTGSSTIQLLRR
jgi:hypothetical protein